MQPLWRWIESSSSFGELTSISVIHVQQQQCVFVGRYPRQNERQEKGGGMEMGGITHAHVLHPALLINIFATTKDISVLAYVVVSHLLLLSEISSSSSSGNDNDTHSPRQFVLSSSLSRSKSRWSSGVCVCACFSTIHLYICARLSLSLSSLCVSRSANQIPSHDLRT